MSGSPPQRCRVASRLIPREWFVWSSGVSMRAEDKTNMKRLMRKTRFRVPGETTRARFVRLRAVIEHGLRAHPAAGASGDKVVANA
jgi:hypothetical protein